jgi:hypothetical protein
VMTEITEDVFGDPDTSDHNTFKNYWQ